MKNACQGKQVLLKAEARDVTKNGCFVKILVNKLRFKRVFMCLWHFEPGDEK